MQFVTMGIVLPDGLLQNMQTGLVPLSSIRFAIATTMPSRNDPSLWSNPCYSGDSTGMYDVGQPWEIMYKASTTQECAFARTMCINPSSSILANRLLQFNFPIGDDTINTVIQNDGTYHLFVTFELSVVDSLGASTITNVFTEAPITRISITKGCEELSSAMTLLSMSEIDVAIGLAGTEELWNTTMDIMPDAMHNVQYNSVIDMGVDHKSIASSLVTLVARAKPALVAHKTGVDYTLSIDYLTTMHFLDDVKFNSVTSLIESNTAFTVDMNTVTNSMEVQFSAAATSSCSTNNNNLYSCAVQRSIVGGQVVQQSAAHDFSTYNTHVSDDDGCRDFITNNILSQNEFAAELATNMTRLVRSRFAIDNYMRRAWYINPGYTWPIPTGGSAQSTLLLSDKMIAVAVITLRNVATGLITGRRYYTRVLLTPSIM
jgi:hypothetical protein